MDWITNESLKLGDAGDDLSFDSAFVVSSSNSEESFVSPVLIPAVGDEPVRSSTLDSPTDNLNSVSSEGRPSGVVINSLFVGGEVSVNGECRLNWTVSHYFSLDLCNLRGDTVDR